MNIEDLKKRLEYMEISPYDYQLKYVNMDPKYSNSFCLEFKPGESYPWIYFYLDERGGVNDVKKYTSEAEACLDFYEEMRELKKWREEKNIHSKNFEPKTGWQRFIDFLSNLSGKQSRP